MEILLVVVRQRNPAALASDFKSCVDIEFFQLRAESVSRGNYYQAIRLWLIEDTGQCEAFDHDPLQLFIPEHVVGAENSLRTLNVHIDLLRVDTVHFSLCIISGWLKVSAGG
jgi:hypothetical protein